MSQNRMEDIVTTITAEYDTGVDINTLLIDSDVDSLDAIINSIYAIDIALAMESFNNSEIQLFYRKIGSERMAKIMEQACDGLQNTIVRVLSTQDILDIFKYMCDDDITDVLGFLRTDVRKVLLNMMRGAENQTITRLLEYDEDSAGGIMTTDYISLREDLMVSEALDKIRKIGTQSEVIETIFVVDDERYLVGTADLRDIITVSGDKTLKDILNNNIMTVTPNVDQEEVSNLVSKYDLKVIPVVNRKNRLLGIITVDDIIDVLVEEQTEDMLKFGGVSGDENSYSTPLQSVKVRLPWLIINLMTASLSAVVISRFEDVIAQVVALSALMPIVAATSGNSGSQTLAIIIRKITLGEINLKDDWMSVGKEISVGMLNSCVTGSVAATFVFVMYNNLYLSAIIFVAMMLNSIVSSACGFFIPLTLKAVKLDPALASNIFLTAITDMMAFFVVLGLASNFIHLL